VTSSAERFVADEQARPVHDRARERDALPLTAGELVRVAVGHAGLEPDVLQTSRTRARRSTSIPSAQSGSPTIRPTLILGSSDAYGSWNTMPVSRRNQCSERADARVDRTAVEGDGAGRRGIQSQQDADERRLARSGLADDPDGRPRADVDVGVVEGEVVADRSKRRVPR
jgi:hypothetical protein